MSSSPSEAEKKELLANMKVGRERAAVQEITDALRYDFIPKNILSGVGHSIDIALKVDRRKIMVSALRQLAGELERGFAVTTDNDNIKKKGDAHGG